MAIPRVKPYSGFQPLDIDEINGSEILRKKSVSTISCPQLNLNFKNIKTLELVIV